jgi:8-oxo-dGTP diphosphatase
MPASRPHPDHPAVICTVDVVLLTLSAGQLQVVLHQRPQEPFAGSWALPGGYIHAQRDESAWHAAARVLQDKAGIVSPYLEQLATYAGPRRDPRGWSVSIVYFALVPEDLLPPDRPGLKRFAVSSLPRLAFDHRDIVELAVARVRSKSQYSSLPVYLCGDQMTLPQLQAVYEAVLGEPVNKVSFRRKIEELGMLEPVEGAQETGQAHRPAQIYRLKPAFQRTLSVVPRGLNA